MAYLTNNQIPKCVFSLNNLIAKLVMKQMTKSINSFIGQVIKMH